MEGESTCIVPSIKINRAGGMAQWLKGLVSKPNHGNSIPGAHVEKEGTGSKTLSSDLYSHTVAKGTPQKTNELTKLIIRSEKTAKQLNKRATYNKLLPLNILVYAATAEVT